MSMLVRVVAPYFVAGFVYEPLRDRGIQTTPILRRWVMGKSREDVRALMRSKRWTAKPVSE